MKHIIISSYLKHYTPTDVVYECTVYDASNGSRELIGIAYCMFDDVFPFGFVTTFFNRPEELCVVEKIKEHCLERKNLICEKQES